MITCPLSIRNRGMHIACWYKYRDNEFSVHIYASVKTFCAHISSLDIIVRSTESKSLFSQVTNLFVPGFHVYKSLQEFNGWLDPLKYQLPRHSHLLQGEREPFGQPEKEIPLSMLGRRLPSHSNSFQSWWGPSTIS